MALQGPPKMSLVAQYDDLCRYNKVLITGCEEEFKVFVESQLDDFRKRKDKKAEVRNLSERISSLEAEKKRLETQMKHLKDIFEAEVIKRREVEKEKKSMERQIAIIKEVLLADCNMNNETREKLAFLSSHGKTNSPPRLATIEESAGSLFSLSDIDRSDDDLEYGGDRRSSSQRVRRSRGKRSSSENRTSPKRKKSHKVEPPSDNDLPENGNLPFKAIGVRSNSEPSTKIPDRLIVNQVHRSDSDKFKFNTYDLRRSNTGGSLSVGTPVGRYSTGGKLSRTHMFATKTMIRTEKCVPCGRIIGFCKHALKCQDCRVICHPECKDQCQLPCIPTIHTPTKGTVGTIADFTSSTAPMIPSLIVHCVNEIESRGLREIGLYRISGSDREVKDLKEKFLRGRTIPCLNQVDIHAVCGTVKEFLRSLKEPLIPQSAWQTFVDTAEMTNEQLSLNALYKAVMDLPQPNRDTLSFFILHLQRIAESPYSKMPIENLAKILGPTIVGHSATDLVDTNSLSEIKYQHKVMLRLLLISSDCWQNLLDVETDVFHTPMVKTPEITPAPKGTRLGPIYSGQKPRNMTLGRTPLTPRNSKFSKTGKMHFSSPLLK